MDQKTKLTDAIDTFQWKGAVSPTGFPHRCPFNQGGMDERSCVEMSGGTIDRNKNGCCGTQRGSISFDACNSKARRCIVCLEQGRRGLKANAVSNIAKGTCVEHDNQGVQTPPRQTSALPNRRLAPAAASFADFRRAQHAKQGQSVPPPAPKAVQTDIRAQSEPENPSDPKVPAVQVLHGEILPPGEENSEPRWKTVIARVRKALANAQLIKLPPDRFRAQPGQPREYFDEGEMLALEQSIREVGQIQDGLCRLKPDGTVSDHELLDGERRWRCVSRAGIVEYRAKLVEIDDEAAPYMIAAISNFNRSEHTAIEKSNAIEKLHYGDLKVPMIEVAKMLGLASVQMAYRIHSLQKLCPEVRNMLDPRMQKKENLLPVMAGYELARLKSVEQHEWQKEFARKVLTRNMTISQLRLQVDRLVLETDGGVGERYQPARRWKLVEGRITKVGSSMRELAQLMQVLVDEKTDPPKAKTLYAADLRNIVDDAVRCLKMLGIEYRAEEVKSEEQ